MPFTPYHFGPSGLIGLVFKKWIDLPVFLLANVIVDIEVLLFRSWPIHRYVHTFLIGAVVGIIWGLAAYPLRNIIFKKAMKIIRIPYQTNLLKMIISGILGIWLHTVVDAIYHYDVRIFWPNKTARPLYRLLSRNQIETLCLICLAAALIIYFINLYVQFKKTKMP